MKDEHVIDIDSFHTLQQVIEDYNLTPFSSLTLVVVELLKITFKQDHATARINLSKEVIPPSYFLGSGMWKKEIQRRVDYPFVSLHKKYRGNTLYIVATNSPTNQTQVFKQRLIHEIKQHHKTTIKRTEIPCSYQVNPYVILSRIKKEHKLQIKIQQQTAKAITYVQVDHAVPKR